MAIREVVVYYFSKTGLKFIRKQVLLFREPPDYESVYWRIYNDLDETLTNNLWALALLPFPLMFDVVHMTEDKLTLNKEEEEWKPLS